MDWVVTYLVTLNHSILDKVLIWWMNGGRVMNIRRSREYFTAATQHHNNIILGEDQWSPVVFIPWQCHPGWIGYVIRCVGWAQVNATHKLTPLKAPCVVLCGGTKELSNNIHWTTTTPCPRGVTILCRQRWVLTMQGPTTTYIGSII